MRLVSQRLLRSISGGGGGLTRLPAHPHVLCTAITTDSPHSGLGAPYTTTQSSYSQHTRYDIPYNISLPSDTNTTTLPNVQSSIACPYLDAKARLLRRTTLSGVHQTRLMHVAPNDPVAEFATGEDRDGTFTRYFPRNILWAVGLFAGIVIGAGFKFPPFFRLNASDTTGMIVIPDEEDDQGSLLPVVKASKGFFAPSSNDDNNNSVGGGKGSDPPKHRAHFNFIADVVERLAPSVVFIEILDLRRTDASGQPLAINNGSGFVVDESGYVLTNAHVVTNRPRASRVKIRLHDGREMVGTLEEVDPYSDLALIKINADNLVPAPMGESSDIRPGEFVVAVGAPLSLSNTVTSGVVSSVSRCARDLGIRANDINYIQTDAAITFGNSGGPLANLDGDVIGINSMKATAGISFAIPVDTAKDFLAKAASKRNLAVKKRDSSSPSPSSPTGRRAYLGITMMSLTKDIIGELQSRTNSPLPPDLVHGVLVWRVVVGSPAYHAGLQPGDVITVVNGHKIKASADIYRMLERPSDLTLVVLRGNNRYTVTVTPEE